MKRLLIIAGVLFFFTLSSYTQDAVKIYRKGLPFMKNYSPDETGAGDQNWVVMMDNRGVMYFGNGDNGVLEFDGVNDASDSEHLFHNIRYLKIGHFFGNIEVIFRILI